MEAPRKEFAYNLTPGDIILYRGKEVAVLNILHNVSFTRVRLVTEETVDIPDSAPHVTVSGNTNQRFLAERGIEYATVGAPTTDTFARETKARRLC